MKKLSSEDKTRAFLDTVNLNKHIVDLRAMALYAVVVSKKTNEKRPRKRLLTDAINEYNSVLSDYEGRTGETYKKANLSLVADIIGGKKYTPLPLIGYHDEREFILQKFDEDFDFESSKPASRREKNREKLRFLRESLKEEKRIARFANKGLTLGFGEKISVFREKIERDILLIKTRCEALKTNAQSRLDYLEYSYSASYGEKRRERRELKESVRKIKKLKKRALKYEKLDSERYYSQLLVTAESAGLTKRRAIDKLDSLNMQLDTLLSERERINEQLIKLYSGDISGEGDKKINQHIRKIKKNVARKTSRRFRREMRVLEKHVPLDVKEKLAKSVNKIIDAEILIATLRYKLRKMKPYGEAKRDMKRKIRENRAAIKYYVADYRRFLKRAKMYENRAKGVKIQIVWVLAALAVTVVLAALYIRYEEPVNAFFGKVFGYVKSSF